MKIIWTLRQHLGWRFQSLHEEIDCVYDKKDQIEMITKWVLMICCDGKITNIYGQTVSDGNS